MTTDPRTKIFDIPVLDLHAVPTVRDVDLGRRLGMARPAAIRRTIARHRADLERHGVLHAAAPAPGGSQASTEYHLTEPQALSLCLVSRAPRAAALRRRLVATMLERRRGAAAPDALAGVITGPCSFPYLCPVPPRLAWHGNGIDTDLSRLDVSRDIVALLPDGSIDSVRLAGPPGGTGGRQGITRRYLDPDSEDMTAVMVIILGHLAGDTGGRVR